MATFSNAEYDSRLAKTKAAMEQAGVDVLLATDTANIHYLTGYDGWSFYTPQATVVALAEEEPLWIGRGIDANGARVTTYLKPGNIYAYGDEYVHTAARHPMDFIAEVLTRRGLDKGHIGLESDSYYLSPRGYACLKAGLPNAALVDADLLVNWVRAIKSAEEIALMRQAARIIEATMSRAIEVIAPGVRQCDAAAEIYRTAISGTPEFGGDYPSIVPMLPTGVGTSTPHLTWSDEPFKEGEATILELAGCRLRYHCPMARTLFLGKPPQKLADMAEVVVEGIEAALAAVRPGVTCEEVEGVWRQTVARHGVVKDSRIGYSTGCNYPPDWGEHTMSLRPGDTSAMRPNMTFHMIPGIWADDWGIELSECFLVTEQGAEPFCNFPRKLFVKP